MTAQSNPALERELAEERARKAIKDLRYYCDEAERGLEREGGRFLDGTALNMARHVAELAVAGAKLSLLLRLQERRS